MFIGTLSSRFLNSVLVVRSYMDVPDERKNGFEKRSMMIILITGSALVYFFLFE